MAQVIPSSGSWYIALTFLIPGKRSGAERSKPRTVLDSKVSEVSAKLSSPLFNFLSACPKVTSSRSISPGWKMKTYDKNFEEIFHFAIFGMDTRDYAFQIWKSLGNL